MGRPNNRDRCLLTARKKKQHGALGLLPQGTELLSKTTRRRREAQAPQSTALPTA